MAEPERVRETAADGADPAPEETRRGCAGLSDRDLAVLEFERRWLKHNGAKEQAIRDQFGLSAARYYQMLGGVIEKPAALVRDPVLVRRLQRVRAARLAARTARLRPPH